MSLWGQSRHRNGDGLGGFQQLLVCGHQDWFDSVSDGAKVSHQDTISPQRPAWRQSLWPALPVPRQACVPQRDARSEAWRAEDAHGGSCQGGEPCDGRHAFSYSINFNYSIPTTLKVTLEAMDDLCLALAPGSDCRGLRCHSARSLVAPSPQVRTGACRESVSSHLG